MTMSSRGSVRADGRRVFVAAAVLFFAAGSTLAQPPQPKTAAVSEIERKHRSHLPLPNTVRQKLVLPDILPENLDLPRTDRRRPLRPSEVKEETVALGS